MFNIVNDTFAHNISTCKHSGTSLACDVHYRAIDGDGVVGVNDILAIIGAWGPCVGGCPADLTNDGLVDVLDILQLLSYW